MFNWKRLLVLLSVGALLTSACGDGDGGDGVGQSADEGPRTVTVQVDGEFEGENQVALLGYFPRETSVRQGDTIEFSFAPGDPHSVSFGALVNQAFEEMAGGGEPATFEKIPAAFADEELELVLGGALPCYAAADPPTDGSACEEQEQPEFSGSLAFYSSGLLNPEDTFTVDIADDAATGTYNFFCALHGPDMSGTVTVVEAGAEGQTADEVEEARQAELEKVAASAKPALDSLADGVHPGLEGILPQGKDQLIAGGFVEEPVGVDILKFSPAEVTVAAGDSLTWNVVGFHTLSFDAPEGATPPIVPDEEGLPSLNPLSFAPQGGAAGAPPPPEGADEGPPPEDSGPPPPPKVLKGGKWDGTGFFSSGVLPSFPPMLLAYEVTFTKAGSYPYVCLIHPEMEGTVTVTD